MPLYDFKCRDCGKIKEELAKFEEKVVGCECGGKSDRIISSGLLKHGECRTIYSEAMGINPSQIPEMKKRFPHHEFTPDGRMIVNGYKHQKQIAKELGMEIL